MIKFFRKARQKMLSDNQFSKYLIYAIGEIVLVVIGILIALQINNWNEQQKSDKKKIAIYEQILQDINDDLGEMNGLVRHYDKLKPVYQRVIEDSITPDLLDKGLSRLFTYNPNISLNTSGIEQLKSIANKEPIDSKVINIYDGLETYLINYMEKQVINDAYEITHLFRDKYDWYAEWVNNETSSKNSSTALKNYFLYSDEYRNRIIYHSKMRYQNYFGYMDLAVLELEEIQKQLKSILEPDSK